MTPEQMERIRELLPVFQKAGGLAEDFRTGKLDVHRYRKTMEEREKVVTTFEAAFGENHPGVVIMLLLQASGYSALRDQREISYVDRALATARKVYGDDHPATADVIIEAANVR